MGRGTIVEVQNLYKYYGSYGALEDVGFTVERGTIVGFLGPNGAGKTTTLRILSGMLPATSGRVFLDGLALSIHGRSLRKSIGYMLENNPLPEYMQVREYLTFRAKLKEIVDVRREVDRVLEICDLKRSAEGRLVGRLSKGFRQRVGIADAMLGHPTVVILDEPTIGLDPHQILEIRRLLEGLKDRTTVIFSSHILAEVEASCSHFVILDHGRVVASGNAHSLQQNVHIPTCYEACLNCQQSQLKMLLDDFSPLLTIAKGEEAGEGFIRYVLKTQESIPSERLIQFLVEKGIPIRHFSTVELTLEQLFLSLTRQPWKQEN